METALLKGWYVELYTWRCSTSGTYRRFEREYGSSGRFEIHFLDELDFARGNDDRNGSSGRNLGASLR